MALKVTSVILWLSDLLGVPSSARHRCATRSAPPLRTFGVSRRGRERLTWAPELGKARHQVFKIKKPQYLAALGLFNLKA